MNERIDSPQNIEDWANLDMASKIEALDEFLDFAPAEKDGAKLATIDNQDQFTSVFSYEDGSQKEISRFGDYSITMFADMDGNVVGFGQVTSDTSFEMALPVGENEYLEEQNIGLKVYPNVDVLVDVGIDVLSLKPGEIESDAIRDTYDRIYKYGPASFEESKEFEAWAQSDVNNASIAAQTAYSLRGISNDGIKALLPDIDTKDFPELEPGHEGHNIPRMQMLAERLAARELDVPEFSPEITDAKEAYGLIGELRSDRYSPDFDLAATSMHAAGHLSQGETRFLMPHLSSKAEMPTADTDDDIAKRATIFIQSAKLIEKHLATPERIQSRGPRDGNDEVSEAIQASLSSEANSR